MTGLANANGSAGGIDLFDGGSYFQVIGNHIYNIGRVCTNTSNGQNGIYIEADNVLVEANLIHDVGRLIPASRDAGRAMSTGKTTITASTTTAGIT